MNCFFCADEGSRVASVGVCIDCGCAACDRHGAVETVRISVRTGNVFEQRPVKARRFRCVACRSLSVAQADGQRARTELAAG